MAKKEVAIDLTWVRPGKVGGTESSIRNLLDGFASLSSDDFLLYLLVSRDNAESFSKYNDRQFRLVKCNTVSKSQIKRVIWQNISMGFLLRKMGIKICLEPIYGKPFFNTGKIDFYTTIFDLQAIHYPEYFSKLRVLWMKISWWNAVKSSKKVIAASEYVKKDIKEHYKLSDDKIVILNTPINVDVSELQEEVLSKYGITKEHYYYTVSSLLPHKNLVTLLSALSKLKKKASKAFLPLVISGVGGAQYEDIKKTVMNLGVSQDVVFTNYVSNEERNELYKGCKCFLFSSMFEGFGMPPLEAMAFEKPVLTTKCTCIEEVTGSLLNYINNPVDEDEWAERLESELVVPSIDDVVKLLNHYSPTTIAQKYLELWT